MTRYPAFKENQYIAPYSDSLKYITIGTDVFTYLTFVKVQHNMYHDDVIKWNISAKASDADLRCFLWSAPDQTIE